MSDHKTLRKHSLHGKGATVAYKTSCITKHFAINSPTDDIVHRYAQKARQNELFFITLSRDGKYIEQF